jgi:mannose/fructose/N-acetylgalactosamine-specific phosphotransferase system component IIC
MPAVPDHLQELINEIADVIEAHTAEQTLEKIDWTNFLAFIMQLLDRLLPILIPLLVKPIEPPPKP